MRELVAFSRYFGIPAFFLEISTITGHYILPSFNIILKQLLSLVEKIKENTKYKPTTRLDLL